MDDKRLAEIREACEDGDTLANLTEVYDMLGDVLVELDALRPDAKLGAAVQNLGEIPYVGEPIGVIGLVLGYDSLGVGPDGGPLCYGWAVGTIDVPRLCDQLLTPWAITPDVAMAEAGLMEGNDDTAK